MNKLNVKGIIFDYGGTLDTRGDHWSEVLWQAYLRAGTGVEDGKVLNQGRQVDKQTFRKAYVYGERALAANPIVLPTFSFKDVLKAKIYEQLRFLSRRPLLHTGKDDAEQQESAAFSLTLSDEEWQTLALRIAGYANEETNQVLAENRQVLEKLREAGFPMVLVSNFYGNINRVLEDAGIRGYFREIVESAVVGIRKPDPGIFALGVEALALPASEVLVVGDTFGKDIVPSHSLGCRTLWLKGLQWEDKPVDLSLCDGIIHRLDELLAYV